MRGVVERSERSISFSRVLCANFTTRVNVDEIAMLAVGAGGVACVFVVGPMLTGEGSSLLSDVDRRVVFLVQC